MISRKSTLLLADAIADTFSNSRMRSQYGMQNKREFFVEVDRLYDFLFENNYEAWFCNLSKTTHGSYKTRDNATRGVKEFILKLHTGETQANSTPQWSWEQRQQLGQRYLRDLAEDILRLWENELSKLPDSSRQTKKEDIEKLQRALELDGYIYREARLFAPEKDVLDVEKEANLLKHLYISLALANSGLAFQYLSLSEEHYENGKWGDSIANSRLFFECVLQEIAAQHSRLFKKIELSSAVYESAKDVRAYLESERLLEKKETEAVAKVYGLLSHTGSHPYMVEKDQARLLRHLALTFSQFVLLRLQGSIT